MSSNEAVLPPPADRILALTLTLNQKWPGKILAIFTLNDYCPHKARNTSAVTSESDLSVTPEQMANHTLILVIRPVLDLIPS